jgi:hypothetical protein
MSAKQSPVLYIVALAHRACNGKLIYSLRQIIQVYTGKKSTVKPAVGGKYTDGIGTAEY